MSIISLSVDQWAGVVNHELTMSHPNWQEVENHIKNLDAKQTTLITMARNNGSHMAIGGGNGKYIVYYSPDGWAFFNLTRVDKTEGIMQLVAGGQLGDYPAKMVVTIEMALKAAWCYYNQGVLSPALNWEED